MCNHTRERIMNITQDMTIGTVQRTFDSRFNPPMCDRKDDIVTGFEGYRAFHLNGGEKLTKGNQQKSHVVFVLNGSAKYVLDGRQGMLLEGEMILVPFNETFTMSSDHGCRILLHTFGAFGPSVSDYLTQLYKSCPTYSGPGDTALKMTPVMRAFADNTYGLVENDLMTEWLSQQKGFEAFHLIIRTYSDLEVIAFFKKLICREQYFRNIVMKHCDTVKNIDELVGRSGMCRTNFYKQFSREFGMSVHRWMQLRRARAVRETAGKPLMTVRKLMEVHHFASPSNFIRFCRLYFGCTPNELIRNLRMGLPVSERYDASEAG